MDSQIETQVADEQNSTLKTESPGIMVPQSESPSTDQPWQEWIEPVADFITQLPDYLGKFFSDYKQPLTIVGLAILGLITAKLTLAILDAINDIPLLAPVFELVGIGYTGWFIYRYLWQKSTRDELWGEFDSLKAQVMGKNSQGN